MFYLGLAHWAFLSIGLLENDTSYIHFMHQSYLVIWKHLFDQEESLFYRDDNYLDKRELNGEKVFCGRGNGWVIAGITNLLKSMPADYSKRQFYVGLFKTMASRTPSRMGQLRQFAQLQSFNRFPISSSNCLLLRKM